MSITHHLNKQDHVNHKTCKQTLLCYITNIKFTKSNISLVIFFKNNEIILFLDLILGLWAGLSGSYQILILLLALVVILILQYFTLWQSISDSRFEGNDDSITFNPHHYCWDTTPTPVHQLITVADCSCDKKYFKATLSGKREHA